MNSNIEIVCGQQASPPTLLKSQETMKPTMPSIDHSKPFIPNEYAALYYTPIFKILSAEQRLRYNQLSALYFNEQIIFFERTLSKNVMGSLCKMKDYSQFKSEIEEYIADETRHADKFSALNQLAAPEHYQKSEYKFVKPSLIAHSLWHCTSKMPTLFPMYLWFMLIQEESALYFGRGIRDSTEVLEPNFYRVHCEHLADESAHTEHDTSVLLKLWKATPLPLRKVNAQLLYWMIKEFFSAPKRSSLHVVETLIQEYPELRDLRQQMKHELAKKETCTAFKKSLYAPEIIPESIRLMQAWPELSNLRTYLQGEP